MAYRLKKIQYWNQSHHILLQNENGPCPLLAAGNVLLLKKSIVLPSACIESGVVTIEELTNILAERILLNNSSTTGSDYHINEVMKIFPNLQFGMDLNPKFTAGPTGVEYTMELNAFDLLRIELVHGWLLESDAQEYEWVDDQTYNQLVNLVIEGNDATAKLEHKSQDSDSNYDELSNKAIRGTVVRNFLDRSAHQLTYYGLTTLHEYVKEGDMVIFFRNNHYNTLTKYKETLYLLVTDLGYASVQSVIWEKLDVIDGDTEYVTGEFQVPPLIKHHDGDSVQSQADHQFALQLSQETSPTTNVTNLQREDSCIERAKKASLLEHKQQEQSKTKVENTTALTPKVMAISVPQNSNSSTTDVPTIPNIVVGIPATNLSQEKKDMMLAMQLHRQEVKQQQQETSRQRQFQQSTIVQPRSNVTAKDSSCIIS
mmetsp:Transcript_7422/g.8170  ORF Transcript_7422/g.8170 Transcript_7422/m.8170 type:complete len:428 (+) Transcript_7422:135-1418(+)